jgi:hypothetical protein
MSRRITLNDTEIEFLVHHTNAQLHHAATDPARGVLTRRALQDLLDKLESVSATPHTVQKETTDASS